MTKWPVPIRRTFESSFYFFNMSRFGNISFHGFSTLFLGTYFAGSCWMRSFPNWVLIKFSSIECWTFTLIRFYLKIFERVHALRMKRLGHQTQKCRVHINKWASWWKSWELGEVGNISRSRIFSRKEANGCGTNHIFGRLIKYHFEEHGQYNWFCKGMINEALCPTQC